MFVFVNEQLKSFIVKDTSVQGSDVHGKNKFGFAGFSFSVRLQN